MRHSILILAFLVSCSWFVAAQAAGLAANRVVDRHTPIEITADKLDVFQEENRAVFTGHVVAIQGDVRLRSARMVVFYRQPAEGEMAAVSTPGGGGGDAIRRIEVEGEVFLSTPLETASGNAGVYDVEKQEIRLRQQVVLTREKNVLKGDRLLYNLATGKSVLTSDGKEQGDSGGGRVRALFVPGNEEKTGGEPK